MVVEKCTSNEMYLMEIYNILANTFPCIVFKCQKKHEKILAQPVVSPAREPSTSMGNNGWNDFIVIPQQNRFLSQKRSDTYANFGQLLGA